MTRDGWQLRAAPAALERRYLAEGWWTDDSLGTLLSQGLTRGAALDFRIHSDSRPWSGTLGDVHALRPDLPELELVVLVGDDERDTPRGAIPFADMVAGDALDAPLPVDPSSPALVAYTSGTTSDPKGVVHSHRTIASEIRQLGAVQPDPNDPPPLVGAPVGHGIGMLAALLIPVYRGQAIHLIDVWDPAVVLATMVRDHVSAGSGATFFLTSLLDHPAFGPEHRALMPRVGLGG